MKYETAVAVGRGAVAEVFKAWDPEAERYVALKMFPPGSDVHSERYRREARVQGRLRHPSICEIYEEGVTGEGRPYIAMRFVDGEPLDRAALRLPIADRVRLVRQVADAVGCAHRADLIHRDLKPGNLLVEEGEDGELRAFVLDFGIVHVNEGTPLTETGQILGTPGYLSPEQARGEAALTARSDVFSLGVVLHQVLTGVLPFEARTTMASLLKVLEHDPPPAHRLNADVPPELGHIAQKAMEKDPQRRYADAHAFGRDLDRYLDTGTVDAPALGRWGRFLRRLERRPLPWLVGAALVLLTLGSWGWSVYRGYRSAEETRQAELFARRSSAIEAQLRFLQLLPRRNLGDDLGRLRRALDELAGDVEASGGRARAAGTYAVGRAQLALGQPSRALETLDRSRELGFDDPVGALTRAWAALAAAGRDLRLVDLMADPAVRAAERARLRDGLQRRVLPELEAASRTAPTEDGSRLLARALAALLADRPGEALPLAERVSEEWPWLFEAHLLQAQAHRDAAVGALEANREDWAKHRDRLDAEQRVLAAALDRAPSAAAVHRQLCESVLVEARGQEARGEDFEEVLELFAAAERSCERAREIDPADPEAGRTLAEIAWRRARRSLRWLGPAEARPFADEAVALAREMREIYPDSPWERWNLGHALFAQAEVLANLGEPPVSVLEAAAAALESGLEDASGLAIAWRSLGHVWLRHGEALVARGENPRPSYRRALAAYDRGLLGSRLQKSRILSAICHAQGELAYSLLQLEEPPMTDVETALGAAVEACDGALRRDGQYLTALSNLALTHWTRVEWAITEGRSPMAAAAEGDRRFEELMALSPGYLSGINNWAGMRAAVGRWRLDAGSDLETAESLEELVGTIGRRRRELAPAVETFPRDAALHDARLAVLAAAATCRLEDAGSVDGAELDAAWDDAASAVRRLESHRPDGELTALRRIELHRRRAACAARRGDTALGTAERRAALEGLASLGGAGAESAEARQERRALEELTVDGG
ncbi:MAG: serine/threonine-protein kinase [Acidobacteriota bacterium]